MHKSPPPPCGAGRRGNKQYTHRKKPYHEETEQKGLTIVELVIVIAVIAILAAVLIPTFSGVVEKANASSALSTAKNAYTVILAASKDGSISDGTANPDAYIKVGTDANARWFQVEDGKLEAKDSVTAPTTGYKTWTHGDANAAGKMKDLASDVTVYVNETAAAKITPTGSDIPGGNS